MPGLGQGELKFEVPIYPACSGEVKELRDFL